jgi:hypothetical protein
MMSDPATRGEKRGFRAIECTQQGGGASKCRLPKEKGMKPRYSISTISILTAYAAVLAAAVAEPFSVWMQLGMFAPFAILSACHIVAVVCPGPRRWFAGGVFFGTAAYMAAIVLLHDRAHLPHEWLSDFIWPADVIGLQVLHSLAYLNALLAFQIALLCGVTTGCLALLIQARRAR